MHPDARQNLLNSRICLQQGNAVDSPLALQIGKGAAVFIYSKV